MLQRNQEQIAKRIGTLSIEDPTLGSSYAETGRDLSFPLGMDPGRVALAGDWDFVGLAQGDVAIMQQTNCQSIGQRERIRVSQSRINQPTQQNRRRGR